MDIYGIHDISALLAGNPYVGRGILIGKTPNGAHAVTAYFIMGRSENSRNRVFAAREGALLTEPFDPSRVKDPSLIIYTALRTFENKLIVTNGDQTDTIYRGLQQGRSFSEALSTRTFEPDAPNFTPRISGMLTFSEGDFFYEMSILKSLDPEGSDCARYTFRYPARPGLAHFIHTYVTDGTPLPAFWGEPERVRTMDDMDAFSETFWNALDENNRISLYLRYTDLATGAVREIIRNKNHREGI